MINIVFDRDFLKGIICCKFVSLLYNEYEKKYIIFESLDFRATKKNNFILGEYSSKEIAERILKEIYTSIANGEKLYIMPLDC